MVDGVAHMLRNGLTANDCSNINYSPPANGDADAARHFQKCNQYLGPNQPGIKNVPGINGTDIPGSAASGSSTRAKAKDGAERSSKSADSAPRDAAKPAPGQPDPSKPRVVLPPGVQELLDGLPVGKDLDEQRERLR